MKCSKCKGVGRIPNVRVEEVKEPGYVFFKIFINEEHYTTHSPCFHSEGLTELLDKVYLAGQKDYDFEQISKGKK